MTLQSANPRIIAARIEALFEGDLVHRHGFKLTGWFFDSTQNTAVEYLEARIGSVRIGTSRLLFDRPDVRALHPAAGPRAGFEFFCAIPEAHRNESGARIHVYARYATGLEVLVQSVAVTYAKIDYRNHGHGYLLTDEFSRVLRREDLYMSGPPSAFADTSCVNLVLRYIDQTGSVLDVGCGIGAYGMELRRRNIAWHGVEVVPEFHERMNEAGLPNTLASPGYLPFADGSYDSAISIEVLEHIGDYETFVAEIARVVRGTVCFSVPNAEAIPLLSYMHVVPWHMLEIDHKNFFNRRSLAALLNRYFSEVEVFTYGNLPNMASYESIGIPNHLFAVARNPV